MCDERVVPAAYFLLLKDSLGFLYLDLNSCSVIPI